MPALKFPIEDPPIVVDTAIRLSLSFEGALKLHSYIHKTNISKIRPGRSFPTASLIKGNVHLAEIDIWSDIAIVITWEHPEIIPFAYDFYRLLNKNTVGVHQIQIPEWLKEQSTPEQNIDASKLESAMQPIMQYQLPTQAPIPTGRQGRYSSGNFKEIFEPIRHAGIVKPDFQAIGKLMGLKSSYVKRKWSNFLNSQGIESIP